ncbi:hypothetical protein [Streptomyces scopuliridis]|uniref:hypothetical protein n=1 Tax=Streptomyces scopuliridis TaxID=452529 RepID=UPI003432F29A
MSAISTRGRMHFVVFTGTFDTGVMCRFPARPAGHSGHEIPPVADGHVAYRPRKARDRPAHHTGHAGHADATEPHHLPPYWPGRNPGEFVTTLTWNTASPKSHRARNQDQLAAGIRRFFPERCPVTAGHE